MSDIQRYLLDYDRSRRDATETARRSATRLQEGQLKLLKLIEELGEYLNSEDGATRAKTMSYLAEVLQCTPQKVLSLQHRNLLRTFILSRVEDKDGGLGSCAKALMALESHGKFDDAAVQETMKALISNPHPLKQYPAQADRYPVLQLVDTLMAKYRDALRQLHESDPQFMSQFIVFFDGEKDPRNLMMVFSILRVPMTEWEFKSEAQDMFDAVFNYFPITFRPPPDDPYGITAQDLKDRLRDCICSTSAFAPFAFPALLDKLESNARNTKRDVLQTIASAASEYGHATMALYSVTLWDALKYEVLNVQEEDLADEALKGLAAIAKTLSQGPTGPLQVYLRPITKECNEHLEDAPTKQSQASAQILRSIAGVSAHVSNLVIGNILPNLFALFQSADTMAKRRGLLEVLVELIKANIEIFGTWRAIGTAGERPPANALSESKDQALGMLLPGLEKAPMTEASFRLVCLDGLLHVAKVRQLLNDEEINKIILLLHAITIDGEPYGQDSARDEVKRAALKGLRDIAQQQPQLMNDTAFPALLAKLPDGDPGPPINYVPTLEAFANIGCAEPVFDTAIRRLKNKYRAVVRQDVPSIYVFNIISAMTYAFKNGPSNLEQSPQTPSYFQDIVLPLLKQASGADEARPATLNDDRTIEIISALCYEITRLQPVERQNEIAAELYTLFRKVPQGDLPPFKSSSDFDTGNTMLISRDLLMAFRKEVALPCDAQDLISALVNYCQQDHLSDRDLFSAVTQLPLVINKFVPTSSLKSCMDPLLDAPMELFSPTKLTPKRVQIIFSCLRGLLLRNSPSLSKLYPKLLSLLADNGHGRLVAHNFQDLLAANAMLTKKNHCQISGLHKQKTFALLVPSITKSFREADVATKPNYLIALSGLLKEMPFAIIVEEVSQLAPLLLQSLDLKDEPEVKKAAIQTITRIVEEKPEAVQEHVSSLIARLLDTTTQLSTTLFPEPLKQHFPQDVKASGQTTDASKAAKPAAPSNPDDVREAAHICLKLIPTQMKNETVLPYRNQVVKRLQVALDDRRRFVRAAAVKARVAWINIDEPEDDD